MANYLIRDRIYSEEIRQALMRMSIEAIITDPRSPWQSPHVEWLIG